VEEFSHALRPLADILLAQPGQDYPKLPALAAQRKVYQLGGLRVRL
jgi:hypothetical protein